MDDAWVLPALPVAAFVILVLVSQYLPRKGDYIAIAAMLASFLLVFPIAADMIDAITGQGLLGWASISLLAAGVATWLAGNIACMHEAADPRSESEY